MTRATTVKWLRWCVMPATVLVAAIVSDIPKFSRAADAAVLPAYLLFVLKNI